jgi:hypothetical protein
MQERPTPHDSHHHKSAAEPPGDSQVTNPNRVIGDGDEITQDNQDAMED